MGRCPYRGPFLPCYVNQYYPLRNISQVLNEAKPAPLMPVPNLEFVDQPGTDLLAVIPWNAMITM